MFSTFCKITVGLGAAALAILAFAPLPAQAAYIVTLQEVGANVVATGSGSINLSRLAGEPTPITIAQIVPIHGEIVTGPTDAAPSDLYLAVTGPARFGTGGNSVADSGSGDFVGIIGFADMLVVPVGYVSGSALSSSVTWNNQTFSSLGVTPGTYVWTWGAAASADSFTLRATIPITTPWMFDNLAYGDVKILKGRYFELCRV